MSVNDSPPAESAEQSPAQQGSSDNFEDAFRSDPSFQTTDASESDEQSATPAADTTPALQDGTPASPEPGAEPTAAEDTRRAPELRTALADAEARLAALTTEAETHKTKATELESKQTVAQREALEQLGDDAEFTTLANKRLDPNVTLTYAEEDRYNELHAKRQNAATWLQMATNAKHAQDAKVAQERGSKLGIDPEAMARASGDTGQLIDLVAAAIETKVKAELNDRVARAEADATSARTRLAGTSRDPGTGGVSGGPGRARTEELGPDASAQEKFAAAFRTEAEGRGSSRPR